MRDVDEEGRLPPDDSGPEYEGAQAATPASRALPPFVRTGPDTPAGRYLRRSWQPVYLSRDLKPGVAVPLRIMSESFTLYRDEAGTAHVIGPRCAHRGLQLSTGFVEGPNLRCVYHGWAYDGAGRCVEQPAEPKPFCQKVKVPAYPTRESLGLIFAYLGPGEPGALPESAELDSCVAASERVRHACNYFQRAENNVDGVHVAFVHRTSRGLGGSIRGLKIPSGISARESPWGLTHVLTFPDGRVEENHFIMPNGAYFHWEYARTSLRVHQRFWYVPIDDEHHDLFVVTLLANAAAAQEFRKNRAPPDPNAPSIDAVVASVLSGQIGFYQLDTSRRDTILLQDAVVTTGLGPISDRSQERLGYSDAGVILLRKIWTRELKLLEAGQPLTAFHGSPVTL
jgi:5,5'-dehydrodivanillate O-demethylase oxygenase subunit